MSNFVASFLFPKKASVTRHLNLLKPLLNSYTLYPCTHYIFYHERKGTHPLLMFSLLSYWYEIVVVSISRIAKNKFVACYFVDECLFFQILRISRRTVPINLPWMNLYIIRSFYPSNLDRNSIFSYDKEFNINKYSFLILSFILIWLFFNS